MTKAKQPHVLYEDSRFTVTTADIKTPTLYYPIADTVGRVRKDIQFAAGGLSLLILAALAIYWDLWFAHEKLAMAGSIAIAVLIGASLTIFQIDARGFPSRLFIARSGTVRKIFMAITKARAQSQQRAYGGMEDAPEGQSE